MISDNHKKEFNTEMRTNLCEIWENWQRVTNTGTSTMLEAHHPNLEVHFSLDSSPNQGRRNRRGAMGWSPHLVVNQLTLLPTLGRGQTMPTKKLFVIPRDFQTLPTALQNASQCSRVGDGQCYNTIETQVNPPHFTLAKNRLHYLLPLCCARSFKFLECSYF